MFGNGAKTLRTAIMKVRQRLEVSGVLGVISVQEFCTAAHGFTHLRLVDQRIGMATRLNFQTMILDFG